MCQQVGDMPQVVHDSSAGSGEAAMVLTTAAVQSGASGGAVLAPSGALVALVTSNARHSSSGKPSLTHRIHQKSVPH